MPIKTDQISHPISIKNEYYLLIRQPVFNSQKQQVGTDLVLFKTQGLEEIIADNRGLGQTGKIFLGSFKNQKLKLFLSRRNENDFTTSL